MGSVPPPAIHRSVAGRQVTAELITSLTSAEAAPLQPSQAASSEYRSPEEEGQLALLYSQLEGRVLA